MTDSDASPLPNKGEQCCNRSGDSVVVRTSDNRMLEVTLETVQEIGALNGQYESCGAVDNSSVALQTPLLLLLPQTSLAAISVCVAFLEWRRKEMLVNRESCWRLFERLQIDDLVQFATQLHYLDCPVAETAFFDYMHHVTRQMNDAEFAQTFLIANDLKTDQLEKVTLDLNWLRCLSHAHTHQKVDFARQ